MFEEAREPRGTSCFCSGAISSGIRGTLFRQTMFAEFELEIHEMAERGEVLTGERLSEVYLRLLRFYHGHDAGVVHIADEYAMEWAVIPHHVLRLLRLSVLHGYCRRVRPGPLPSSIDNPERWSVTLGFLQRRWIEIPARDSARRRESIWNRPRRTMTPSRRSATGWINSRNGWPRRVQMIRSLDSPTRRRVQAARVPPS